MSVDAHLTGKRGSIGTLLSDARHTPDLDHIAAHPVR